MQFFEFTEEQEMLRKVVRDFAKSEVAPNAADWDEEDRCPAELFPLLGELGINGIFAPEEFGGTGLGHVERAICLEEISRYSGGLGIALMTHQLAIAAILYYGNEEQKSKYLPDLCSGKRIGGLSVTEPGGGSDFIGQKATGEEKDGNWLINGRKCFITNSSVADIDIVTVRTGEDEKGRVQLTAFVLDQDTSGRSVGRKEHKLGLRGSVTGDVIYNNAEVESDRILKGLGAGAQIAMASISEVGRAGMAAICTGILRGCLEESIKFSKERVLYGKPISKLQGIQFILAENKLDYDTASLLLYRAAAMKDAGKSCATEFAMAKLHATEAAVNAAKRTMDLMGGYGIINEYPVGRFMRDALASIPSGGTSAIQKIIIAASVLK
ncbi:MAG: acyl-CoA dehydrogenase [Bacillota bacterium]|jgi:alkylation response protein AidB-like acyl-CoA dehydrogenase|nr:acyl-CoA dehydrogenase [Bacillota bacterium]